ncbi:MULTISPECIES: hypothetical protein [unclassified Streptomyces]|uniref:hypothetical protein n=1 Tax=unclassified Streptomyces TaxID=2593676 RepID=UPI00236696AC|nr:MULTISPECIES: hypothetical protein [unclassified Streptomyces]MDF3147227.1 hypothetical protein [Streptomyces sp. T21Q-yed]WDF37843.1 hypothetical protein PBV52_14050 [Streptomyces sp. T12]
MNTHRRMLWPGAVVGAAVLMAGACSGSAGGSERTGAGDCVHVVDEETGRTGKDCLPLAPESQRVDLAEPTFTHPTRITNPLHPTSEVDQVVMGGQVDDEAFRTEVSLLPGTKTIEFDGRTVQALTQQYVAFADGRIQEVALDWYAQADDGSVWYLGEDVFNYEDGVVADTEGTWQAGRDDAPAAMIMPAQPEKGDVYRPENLPGVVFEEVTVQEVDRTVDGPYGKVKGAITVRELHMDGSTEDKTFAPGYGEFSTGNDGGDLEAVSLAVPTDAQQGPLPGELGELDRAAQAAQDGQVTEADLGAVQDAWTAYRDSDAVPELLHAQMTRDLDTLDEAASAKDEEKMQGAALRVAQNTSDLRLRHEPVRTVDLDRFDLWARQLGIDARAGDEGAVAGDVTSLELVWERLKGEAPRAEAAAVTADLRAAREAADRKDMTAAGQLAPSLVEEIAALTR